MVVTIALPLQTAPPVGSFYPAPALPHAIRVEGASIHHHVGVRLDMKVANYSVWHGLMLETIDHYDVADHIFPDFNDHRGDTA